MFEWFDRVGADADIAALRRDFSEVRWHSFADWAREFDWSVLERWVQLGPRAASAPGPFIRQQRTCSGCWGMSVWCQHRTHAPQQSAELFDHLAGPAAIKSLHITIVMQRFISEISS